MMMKMKKTYTRMIRYIFLLVVVMVGASFMVYRNKAGYLDKRMSLPPLLKDLNGQEGLIVRFNKSSPPLPKDLNGQIELTVRFTPKKEAQKGIHHMFCTLLRSAVLFWNSNYGDVVVILDKDDAGSDFSKKLDALHLPLKFRYVYEEHPSRAKDFVPLIKITGRSQGYTLQLYSSFLMDLYTSAKIIAWMDADAALTMPVVEESIVRNGKIVVKGTNNFRIPHTHRWNRANIRAIGHRMTSDFMAYFPVFVYASTIKRCREFIMRRFNVTRFEDAFLMMFVDFVSPVNVIMTYAYHYERELYDWHIDIGATTLNQYNKDITPNNPLLPADVSPELHVSVHAAYYKSLIHPITQGLCYTQIYLGMQNITHCKGFYGVPNMQLFTFDISNNVNNLNTWCRGDARRTCEDMIKKRYEVFVRSYKVHKFRMDTAWIGVLERFAREQFQQTCLPVMYVPFPEQ